jgi:hypothetical protein
MSPFLLAPDGAVLDRQTGLTWEPRPLPVEFAWVEAIRRAPHECWRLPTIGELMDLLTRLPAAPFPALEPGSIFWSTSESPFARPSLVRVAVCEPGGNVVVSLRDKTNAARRWRVRDVATGATP